MYLLILHEQQDRIFNSIQFTFHNVSINSQISFQYLSFFFPFTFHNVSINSIEETAQEASPDLIYIP